MKYSVLVLVAALMAFSTPVKKSIRINGIYNVAPKEGEKIFLTILLDAKAKKRQMIDSAAVKDKKFFFNLKDVKPGKYDLGNKGGQYFSIYLDYGQSNVIIDSAFMSAKVRGNITDSLIKKFERTNTGLSMIQMGAAFMSIKYKKEGKEVPDSLLKQLQDQMVALTELRKKTSREVGLRKDMAAAYVLANGAAGEFTTAELNSIYAGMPEPVKTARFGMDFKTVLDKINNVEVGVKAPAFTQQTPKGTEVQLQDFIKGKKLVLIDFWASWCGPCRKENPNVVAMYNKFKSQGFDIIGVSLDSKKEEWIKAIEADNLTWMHVSDLGGWKNSVAKLYNVSAVPHTILLNGNGVIIAKNLRGKELEVKVEEICSGKK